MYSWGTIPSSLLLVWSLEINKIDSVKKLQCGNLGAAVNTVGLFYGLRASFMSQFSPVKQVGLVLHCVQDCTLVRVLCSKPPKLGLESCCWKGFFFSWKWLIVHLSRVWPAPRPNQTLNPVSCNAIEPGHQVTMLKTEKLNEGATWFNNECWCRVAEGYGSCKLEISEFFSDSCTQWTCLYPVTYIFQIVQCTHWEDP